ncbi:hypothetical protein BY458DRAFT_499586 [Sporodiniella umbellata]|nr:hypothetical protein BY458DRAFT_499586 [Sporodiniella umbellata]
MSLLQRKKTTPEKTELPERDANILAIYTRRVQKFDRMFKVCCCWVGYDVLLEFIPIVGKVISLIFALSLFNLACSVGLPGAIKKKMIYHITVDFLLGLIPILGILLDMLYQAHSKNATLLKRFLYERARQNNLKETALQT